MSSCWTDFPRYIYEESAVLRSCVEMERYGAGELVSFHDVLFLAD
jgi:hypothetical protein